MEEAFFERRKTRQRLVKATQSLETFLASSVKLGRSCDRVGSFESAAQNEEAPEQRAANSEQRPANSEQRTASKKQRAANGKQRAANRD